MSEIDTFNEFMRSSMVDKPEDGEIINTGFGKVALEKEVDVKRARQEFNKKFPDLMENIKKQGMVNLNDFSSYFHINVSTCVIAIGLKTKIFGTLNLHPDGKMTDTMGRITMHIVKGEEFE